VSLLRRRVRPGNAARLLTSGRAPDVARVLDACADVEVKVTAAGAVDEDPVSIARAWPLLTPEQRGWALHLLAWAESRAASEVLAGLLARRDSNVAATLWGGLGPLRARPRDEDILVPALLAATASPALRPDAAAVLAAYAAAGLLYDQGDTVSRRASELVEASLAAGGAGGLHAVPLLKATAGRQAAPLLVRAAEAPDDDCARAACVALEQLGVPSPEVPFARLAADPVHRCLLHQALEDCGRTDRFPAAWGTQERLAESVMVEWLTFPTELGRPPDAIELLDRRPHRVDGVDAAVYLFRFRSGRDEETTAQGWMVGLAGAFPVGGAPTAYEIGALTCSHFVPEREMSLDDHAALLLG
jgi:hypothetical protein